jgi:hypothetical protein
MSLISDLEAIKSEFRTGRANLDTEATSTQLAQKLRIELTGVWKAIDTSGAAIDNDKAQLGF